MIKHLSRAGFRYRQVEEKHTCLLCKLAIGLVQMVILWMAVTFIQLARTKPVFLFLQAQNSEAS